MWHKVCHIFDYILVICLLENLYVAEVSPVHKITFSEEFNSSLTIKSSLRPLGYEGCLKKSKSNGISNLLSNFF